MPLECVGNQLIISAGAFGVFLIGGGLVGTIILLIASVTTSNKTLVKGD